MKKTTYKKFLICLITFLFIGSGTLTATNTFENSIEKINLPMNKTSSNFADDEVDQQQINNDAATCLLGSMLFAQSFKPSLNTLTRVKLLLNKIGDLYGDSILSIREDLNGIDLTTVSVESLDINQDFEWIEFDFQDISVTPGDLYYIILKPDPESDGGEGSKFISWSFGVENPYVEGSPFIKYNDSWSEGIPGSFTADYSFKTYGYHKNQPPVADAGGPYYGNVNSSIVFNGTGSNDTDGVIEFYKWEFGNGEIGSGETPIHSYSTIGEYTVSLIVTDNDGATDRDNTTVTIYPENTRPQKPNVPTGEVSGKIGEEYTYSSSAIDEDDDLLLFKWSWGDGTTSEWIGTYASNETCEATHVWTEKSDYEIKVKVRDEHGLESEWSDPLPISMPKTKDFSLFNNLIKNNPLIYQLLSFLLDVTFPLH